MTVQKRRNLGLGLALVVTLGLVVWINGQDQEGGVDLAQTKREHVRPGANTSSHSVTEKNVSSRTQSALDWTLLAGRESTEEDRAATTDLFKSHSWYVPPPPKSVEPPPPPPPPKPVAPAVPFAYLGKLEGTPQGTLLLLSAGNKVYTVAVGESIDKIWRVEADAASSVTFTYLPLGLPQTLSKTARPAPAQPNETQGNPE